MKHSKKEYIVKLLFDDKGYEIGTEFTGEVVRCKECKHWQPHSQHGYDYDYDAWMPLPEPYKGGEDE